MRPGKKQLNASSPLLIQQAVSFLPKPFEHAGTSAVYGSQAHTGTSGNLWSAKTILHHEAEGLHGDRLEILLQHRQQAMVNLAIMLCVPSLGEVADRVFQLIENFQKADAIGRDPASARAPVFPRLIHHDLAEPSSKRAQMPLVLKSG